MAGLNKLQLQVFGRESVVPIPIGNLIAYWKLDGNSNDASGNGHNGADTSVSYVSGKVNDCADFTASTSSVITIPDSNSLSFGNGTTDSPFSFSFWFKLSSLTNDVQFLNKMGASTREYQVVYSLVDGMFYFHLISQGNFTNRRYNRFIITPSLNQWYHIAGTYDGDQSNPNILLYINGVVNPDTTVAVVGTYVAMSNTTNTLKFGKFATSTNLSLDGFMDEIAMFNKKLTPAEVESIFKKGNSGNPLI